MGLELKGNKKLEVGVKIKEWKIKINIYRVKLFSLDNKIWGVCNINRGSWKRTKLFINDDLTRKEVYNVKLWRYNRSEENNYLKEREEGTFRSEHFFRSEWLKI